MNLYEAWMTPCIIMDKTTTNDGIGGTIERYQEGASFDAAIVIDTSTEARLAESANSRSIFTVTTKDTVKLPFDTVFMRVQDGKFFRTTSNNRDKVAPEGASFRFAQCSAVSWELVP